MHIAHTITVLDRTGLHTGAHVPPPSRQRKARPASTFDKAAIMRDAWRRYRHVNGRRPFDRQCWALCLGYAWIAAKAVVKRAKDEAEFAARLRSMPAPKPATGRAAEIDAELLAIDMIDRQSSADVARIGELKSERAGIWWTN